jgi:hypothetical protein
LSLHLFFSVGSEIMRLAQIKAILAAVVLTAVLAGCSANSLFDRLPTEAGGEPTTAPARPANPYLFPAVHDMPPPRSDQPLTEEQQVQMEKDLQTIRDRQESQAADPAEKPAKKAVQNSKKQPAVAIGSQVGGDRPNP